MTQSFENPISSNDGREKINESRITSTWIHIIITHTHTHTHVYIYIERERDREIERMIINSVH